MKLQSVEQRVLYVLENHPEARESDDVLFSLVYENCNPIVVNMSFEKVMKNRAAYGLPTLESIRRSRQMIANRRPDLDCSKRKRRLRDAAEEEYREYARNKETANVQ